MNKGEWSGAEYQYVPCRNRIQNRANPDKPSPAIIPSALKGKGRIKELIDALPEHDREKALALLLEAKNRA